MTEACLRIGGEEIRLQRLGLQKKPVCRRVVVAETWSVVPRSEAIIPGLLDGSIVPEEVWGKLDPSGKHGLYQAIYSLVYTRYLLTPILIYNSRSKDELRPPKCRIKNTERSFIFRACKLWNTLEEQVKQLKTLSQFKNAVKKRLHQKFLNVLTLNGTYF